MSSLWTPEGERPVRREPPAPATAPAEGPADGREPTEEEIEAATAEYLDQLLDAPPEAVVGNHAVQLFELARIYLTAEPPMIHHGQLAIDAMGALVEGLAGRLGADEAELKAGLAQLRMAFVQIRAANLGQS